MKTSGRTFHALWRGALGALAAGFGLLAGPAQAVAESPPPALHDSTGPSSAHPTTPPPHVQSTSPSAQRPRRGRVLPTPPPARGGGPVSPPSICSGADRASDGSCVAPDLAPNAPQRQQPGQHRSPGTASPSAVLPDHATPAQ